MNAPAPKPPHKMPWRVIALIGFVAGVGTAVSLIYWNPFKREVPHHRTQFPSGYDFDDPPLLADMTAARGRMDAIAEALNRYRDQHGDGVRWPMSLDDLFLLGLLPEGFDLTGVLSGRPVSYAPDMPAGRDPSRWAICSDVELGWRRVSGRYGAVRVPRVALVILADGAVRELRDDEIDTVGGLVYDTSTR